MFEFDHEADIHTYTMCAGLGTTIPTSGIEIGMGETRVVLSNSGSANVTITAPSFTTDSDYTQFTYNNKFIYDEYNQLKPGSLHAPNAFMGPYPPMNSPFSSSSVCDPNDYPHYAVDFVAGNCGDFFDENLLSHNLLYFKDAYGVIDGTTVIPARRGDGNAPFLDRIRNTCSFVADSRENSHYLSCLHAISLIAWCNTVMYGVDNQARVWCFLVANQFLTVTDQWTETTNYITAGFQASNRRTGFMPAENRLQVGAFGVMPHGSGLGTNVWEMGPNLLRYYGFCVNQQGVAVHDCSVDNVRNGLFRSFHHGWGAYIQWGAGWEVAGAFRNRMQCDGPADTDRCTYFPWQTLPWRWGFADAGMLLPAIAPCFARVTNNDIGADGGCFQSQGGTTNRWTLPAVVPDGQTRTSAQTTIYSTPVCDISPSNRRTLHSFVQPECLDEPAFKFNSNYGPGYGPDMSCPNMFYLGNCDPPVEDGCHLGRSRDGNLATTSTAFLPGSSMFDTLFIPDSITFSGEFDEIMKFHMTPYFSPFLVATVGYPRGTGPGHDEYDVFGAPIITGYETFGETGTQLPTSVTFQVATNVKFYLSAFIDPAGCSAPFDQYSGLTPSGLLYNVTFILYVNASDAFACNLVFNTQPGDEDIRTPFSIDIDVVPYVSHISQTSEVTNHDIDDGDHCFLFDPCPSQYGWIYIFVALAIMTILIVLCCCCRSGGCSSVYSSKTVLKQTSGHKET